MTEEWGYILLGTCFTSSSSFSAALKARLLYGLDSIQLASVYKYLGIGVHAAQ